MRDLKRISGSGGGGKGGGGGSARTPEEEADSLRSRAYAKVIDVISEGEIQGLVDGLRSIYLDGTPIVAANGSANFSGTQVTFRIGSQDQQYIPDFSQVENEIAAGIEVFENTPFIRTVSNTEVDAVKVRISFPQLTRQSSDTGDISGTSVRIAFDVQSNGGGFQEIVRDTITGKSTSKYERTYRLELLGSPPWDFRVRRLTDDSTTVALQNRTFVESYTEVIDAKLKYPNTALCAVRIDSSQFSSIPTRGYEIYGLKVLIPENYDPTTRTYDGSWSGNWKVEYTDNPAWIFYDIVTHPRYGLGQFVGENFVDKWALYQIAQYCDELVPNGFGGTEPRFTCNAYIQTRQEAYKLMQDLASCFRSMVYWAGGLLTVAQDSPSDPIYLFNQANVVDGIFNYSGSSAKSRHTVALVTYNDPSDGYKQKVEYVEDTEAISRFGIVETQVVAFGCTSRGQAHRVGKWLLYSEQYQTEVVQFKSGLDGALLLPGQIVRVADSGRTSVRLGGRVTGGTASSVQIDDSLVLDPTGYSFSVLRKNGSIETRSVSSIGGNVINLGSALSETPDPGTVWVLQSEAVNSQLFKILSITETDGGIYEITAVNHDPSKYDYIENNLTLETRSISDLNEVPDSPTAVEITETLYSVGSDVRVKITVSWNKVRTAAGYVVKYQKDEGNPITVTDINTNEFEILNAEPGVYTVSVFSVSALGIRSIASTAQKTILGKTRPPSNMTNFSLLPVNGAAYLSWDKSADLDVLIGGTVRIRYSPNIVDPVWKDSVDILPAQPGSSTRATAPLLSGSYMAKFVDSSGVACDAEALLITTVPTPSALNVVATITESPAFAGTKANMTFVDLYDGLSLAAALTVDDITFDVDDIPSWDFAGGVSESGEYLFEDYFDLSEVYTSRVTANIAASAIDVTDTIDQRVELVDDWQDLDGNFIDDVNAELFLRTTDDDPGGVSPVWSEWKRFFQGDYTCRAYQFKLVATSQSQSHNIAITDLSVVIDMPDRVEAFNNIASGTSTYTVTFEKPFKAVPAVGITANSLNSGDYFVLSNKTRTGFDIVFKNSGGTNISRTFDVLARGYGRQMN